MALGRVTSYIKNVAKSVVYATDDTFKALAPAMFEYKETNAEIAKNVYGAIRDYRGTYQRTVNYLRSTKVYEAGTAAAQNAFDDLLTGKFYNKERALKMDAQAFGMDMSMDDMNFDDLDKALADMDNADDVTTGDKATISAIESTSKASASTISKAVIESSKYSAEVSKMNTSILFSQNERLFGRLQAGLGTVNDSINNILKFHTNSLQTHIENSTKFYDVITKNTQEQTAILKEMLEMQRQEYAEKQKFAKEREKRKKRQTFSDLVGAQGSVNFGDYFNLVGSNLKTWFDEQGGSFLNMNMGDGDANPLLAFASNPLQFIPLALVDAAMGPKLKTYLKKLDKSVSGMFGTFIARMNAMAKGNTADSEDDMFKQFIGRIFGIHDRFKTSLDTANYNKGAVPFDGITKKAIVDVIPTYLAKIESAITGAAERIFDYNKGTWTDAVSIRKNFEQQKRSTVSSAFSDVWGSFGSASSTAKLRFESYAKQVGFNQDIHNFFMTLYDKGGYFNPNKPGNASDWNVQSDENFKAIIAMWKQLPKEVQMRVSSEVMESRNRYSALMQNDEDTGTSIYTRLFDNSQMNQYLKIRETKDKSRYAIVGKNIMENRDSYGYRDLDYLRMIVENTGNIMVNTNSLRGYKYYQNQVKGKKSRIRTTGPNTIDSSGGYAIPKSDYTSNLARLAETDANLDEGYIKRIQNEKGAVMMTDDNMAGLMGAAVAEQTARRERGEIKTAAGEYWLSETIRNAFNAPHKAAKKKMEEEISGEALREDFKKRFQAAQTISGKFSVILDKVYSYAEAPSRWLSNMLIGANNAVYDFFFEKENEASPGQKVKGFFNLMIDKTVNLFDRAGNALTEKVINPLREKLGLDEKYDNLKAWFKDTRLYSDYIAPVRQKFFNKAEDLLSDVSYTGGRLLDDLGFTKSAKSYAAYGIEDDKYDQQKYGTFTPYRYKENKTQADKDQERDLAYTLMGLQGRARGARYIKKGGITAISKGEMIIPAEMNPFNPDRDKVNKAQEMKQEQEYINRFSNSFTRAVFGEIPKNAEGTTAFGYTDAIKKTAHNQLKAADRAMRDVFYVRAGDAGAKAYDDVIGNPKKYIPEGLAGGALGGILGLVTGLGPMAGMLIGAGASVANSSEAVKNWLFGEKINDYTGERKGGALLSRDMQNKLYYAFPDMKKWGLAGGLAGLVGLAPFGIVGGITLGAAAAYAKNNTNIMNFLFGDTEGAILNKERKEYLKKHFPAMAAGTAATYVLGPFGLVGSAILGSAAGLLTTSDSFKEALFGKEMYDGKRHGGIVGTLEESFVKPITNFGKSMTSQMQDFLKNDIMKPLAAGIAPITRNLAFMVSDIGKVLAGSIGSVVGGMFSAGGVLSRYLGHYVGSPLARVLKPIVGLPFLAAKKTAGALISSPFKLIGKLGEMSQRSMIQKGRAYHMTSEERLAYAAEHGFDYAGSDLDKTLSKSDYKTVAEMERVLNQIGSTKKNAKAAEQDLKTLESNLKYILNNPWLEHQIKLKLLSGDKAMITDALQDIDRAGNFSSTEDKEKFMTYVLTISQGILEDKAIAKRGAMSEDQAFKRLSELTGMRIDSSNIDRLKATVHNEASRRKDSLYTKSGVADENRRVENAIDNGTQNIVTQLKRIEDILQGAKPSSSVDKVMAQNFTEAKNEVAAGASVQKERENTLVEAVSKYYDGAKFTDEEKQKIIDNFGGCYSVYIILRGADVKLENATDIFKLSRRDAHRIILLKEACDKYSRNLPKNLIKLNSMSDKSFGKLLELAEYGVQIKDISQFSNEKRLNESWHEMRASEYTDQDYSNASLKFIKANVNAEAFKDGKQVKYDKRRGRTQITEHGIIRTIISTDGEETFDMGDSDTKEAVKNAEESRENAKKTADAMSAIGKLFTGTKIGAEKKDKEASEGFFSKLLGKAGTAFGAIGSVVGGAVSLALRGFFGLGKAYLFGKAVKFLANNGPQVQEFVSNAIKGVGNLVSEFFTAAIDLVKKSPDIISSIWGGVKDAVFGVSKEEQLERAGIKVSKFRDGSIHYYNKDGKEIDAPTLQENGLLNDAAGLIDSDPKFLTGVAMYGAYRSGKYLYNTYRRARDYIGKVKSRNGGKFSVGGMIKNLISPEAEGIQESNNLLSRILYYVSGKREGSITGAANEALDAVRGTNTMKTPTTGDGKVTAPSKKKGVKGAAARVVDKIKEMAVKAKSILPGKWGKVGGSFLEKIGAKIGPRLAASAAFLGGGGFLFNAALSLPALLEGYNQASNLYGVPDEQLTFTDKVVASIATYVSDALLGIISPQTLVAWYTPDSERDYNTEKPTTMVASATPSKVSQSPASYQNTIAKTATAPSKAYAEGSIAASVFGVGKFGRGNYFKQTDPRYANMRFNVSGDTMYQNMADSGCGPVAAVNAIYGRGNIISPVEAAQFAMQGGYKEKDGGTRPGFFGSYFNAHGRRAEYTSGQGILRNLASGNPVVMMGQDSRITANTPYGPGPHYVTATGLDGRGNMIIQDPQDSRNDLLYPINKVLSKTKFGVAARGKYGRGIFGRGRIPTNDDIGAFIWQKFVSFGKLKEHAIAGIMGNMYAESGLQPRIVQGGTYANEIPINGTLGYGLCQWTSEDRQKNLADYAKSVGKSSGDAEVQVEFTMKEMEGYSDLIAQLNGAKSAYDAAIIFHRVFERSADNAQQEARRGNYAEQILEKKGVGISGKLVTKTTFNGSSASGGESTMGGFIGYLTKRASGLTKIYNSIFGGSSEDSSSSGSYTSNYKGGPLSSKATTDGIKKAIEWTNTSKLNKTGYGNTGCTAFVKDFISQSGNTELSGNMPLWVPYLMSGAQEGNIWRSPQDGARQGDIAIIETNRNPGDGPDHAVIADGSGGYYGNSSSRNLVVHGKLGTDFGASNIVGYVASGDPRSKATTASGETTRTQDQIIADAGPTSAMGKYGRGKFGKGIPVVPTKNLFGRANAMAPTTQAVAMQQFDYRQILQDIYQALLLIVKNTGNLSTAGNTSQTVTNGDMGNAVQEAAAQKQDMMRKLKDKIGLLRSANGLGQLPFTEDINNITALMAQIASQ